MAYRVLAWFVGDADDSDLATLEEYYLLVGKCQPGQQILAGLCEDCQKGESAFVCASWLRRVDCREAGLWPSCARMAFLAFLLAFDSCACGLRPASAAEPLA